MQVLVKFAGQSFRLLAVAVGTPKHVTPAELVKLDLQQAEARCGQLHLVGVLVLPNHVRRTSRDSITNLQDKYGLACCTCATDEMHLQAALSMCDQTLLQYAWAVGCCGMSKL